MRPDWSRGRTIFPRARGDTTEHHGPLERLLEVTLTTTTVRVRPGRRKRTRKRSRVKRAPAKQLTKPIHACVTTA